MLALAGGCGSEAPPAAAGGEPSRSTGSPTLGAPASPTPSATPTSSSPTPAASSTSAPSSSTPAPTSGTSGSATPAPAPTGLVGERRNAWAFAPLDDPTDITVEGRVPRSPAWSTSKVLVVAAFLATVADGDPDRLSRADRSLVEAALVRSEEDAVLALRQQIRGRPGAAMTAVLRSVGDTTTEAPDNYHGPMEWGVGEQVRFMAALANGKVVSQASSRYLLATMQPTREHAWGLGTIGATAFKGGWLRSDSVTRQLGVVDGYAVALITDGVGPTVRQTDGDFAHVSR